MEIIWYLSICWHNVFSIFFLPPRFPDPPLFLHLSYNLFMQDLSSFTWHSNLPECLHIPAKITDLAEKTLVAFLRKNAENTVNTKLIKKQNDGLENSRPYIITHTYMQCQKALTRSNINVYKTRAALGFKNIFQVTWKSIWKEESITLPELKQLHTNKYAFFKMCHMVPLIC